MSRARIAEFGIIQKALAGASATFFLCDGTGANTGTKATLYTDSSTGATTQNPQTLDGDGKLSQDCWVDSTVMASISGLSPLTRRGLEKIRKPPLDFALPVTSAAYSKQAAYDLYVDLTAVSAAAAAAAALLANASFIAVAGDLTGANHIGTVAGAIGAVNSVAANTANINTVATNLGGTNTIGTVATNIANVNTVSGISGNVTTVATISGNVTSVAGNAANINSVAGSIANVNSVAADLANINTVAGAVANINTVAGSIANVNICAANIASINTVAGYVSGGMYVPMQAIDANAASTNMATNTTYFMIYGAARGTLVLPAASNKGDEIVVIGASANGWKITWGAGQSVKVRAAAGTATTGNVQSGTGNDTIRLKCSTANLTWIAETFEGNLVVN